ncbi:MAG: CPBP family intramembrane metalloprotease [Candidatus Colwellbacteria bacterium]|nr:CPBP family intramembrane metalloprotease [Candidatus Colwellbacteria bacterium]
MSYGLKTFLQIIIILVVPIILLQTKVIPSTHGIADTVLGTSLILITGIAICERFTLKELGIRRDNLQPAVLPYALFTLAGVAVIFGLANLLGRHPQSEWFINPHFRYLLFIPISIIQQFAFQGVLMAKLRRIFSSPALIIFIVAALYAYMHIIFPPLPVSLPFAFVAGLGFAAIYYFYPNLILASLSHIILNFFAVLYCFFTFTQTCSF